MASGANLKVEDTETIQSLDQTEGLSSNRANNTQEESEETKKDEKVDKEEDGAKATNVKSTKQRMQTAKVGILDLSLFGSDVMSDGVQVATHYANCNYNWAALTAVFMFLPVAAESLTLLGEPSKKHVNSNS